MATPFTNVHNAASISTSEYFLFSNSTVATYQTTAAKVSGWIDFVNMTSGETYDVKIYEKVNAGTAKLAYSARLVGVQSELFWIPEFWAVEGYEVSVTKVAGTDRSIIWSLNRDVGDSNTISINGNSTAASNLNLQFNGTGLTGTTFPARQDTTEWRRATAQTGSTGSTLKLDAGANATNDYYNGAWVSIVSGTGADQTVLIYDYVGSTKVASVTPSWTTTPDNTSVFVIHRMRGVDVEQWGGGVNLPAGLDSAGNMPANTNKLNSDATAATNLANAFGTGNVTSLAPGLLTRRNTAQAGAAGSITLDASASATTDIYTGSIIAITSGTGAGQAGRTVTAYNGTTKVATISPNWTTTPDNTSVFEMTRTASYASGGGASAATIAAAVWDEARAGHTTAGSYGKTSEWAGTSSLTAADIWDVTLASHITPGSTGEALNTAKTASSATPAAIADAVWDELATDHATAGTMGANLQALAEAVLIWPTPAGGTVTASTLITRAMTISDMHDNFVSTSEWLTWLNQEQKSLQLFLARAGWALPFYTASATITSTGWDLAAEGGAATSVAKSAAGRYIFTPTAADVMALVCVHESRNGDLKLLKMESDVDFLRQTAGSTNATSHATSYRVRRYGTEVHLEFYPTPQAGEIYYLTFLNAPVPISAITESLSLPMGWEERLVLGMARRALIKEQSDPSQIEKLMAEMDKEIEELCWNTVMSESPRVRGTDSSLQTYRNGVLPWQNWYWF